MKTKGVTLCARMPVEPILGAQVRDQKGGVIGKVQKVTKESEGVWMTEVSLDVREEDIQKLLGQEFSMGINAKSYQALCKDEAN